MPTQEYLDFDFEVAIGDTVKLDVAVTRPAGGPAVDVTGATFYCTGKTSPLTQSDVQAQFQKTSGSGIVIANAAGGLVTVTIAPSDTSSLTAQTRLYVDVQMNEADGTVTTVSAGQLEMFVGATRS